MWSDKQTDKHDEANTHVQFGMDTNHKRTHRMLQGIISTSKITKMATLRNFEVTSKNIRYGESVRHVTTIIIKEYLESFEMWCWRRVEKISWTDRVRN
jgi:hypothetical protein